MKKRQKSAIDQYVDDFAGYTNHPKLNLDQRIEQYLNSENVEDVEVRMDVKVRIFSQHLFEIIQSENGRDYFLKMDPRFQDRVMAQSLFWETRVNASSSRPSFQVRDKLAELKLLLGKENDDAFFTKAIGREIYLEMENVTGQIEIDKFQRSGAKKKNQSTQLQIVIDSSIGFAFYLLEKNHPASEEKIIADFQDQLLANSEAKLQIDGIALYWAIIEEGQDGKTTQKLLQKIQSNKKVDCPGYSLATTLYLIERYNHTNKAMLQNFVLSRITDPHEKDVAVEYFEEWSGQDIKETKSSATQDKLTSSSASYQPKAENPLAQGLKQLDAALLVNAKALTAFEKDELCHNLGRIISNLTLIEFENSTTLSRDKLVGEKEIFELKFEDRREEMAKSKGRVSQRMKPFFSGLEKAEYARIMGRPNDNDDVKVTEADLQNTQSSSTTRKRFPNNIGDMIAGVEDNIANLESDIAEERSKSKKNQDIDFIKQTEALIKNHQEDLFELKEMYKAEKAKQAGQIQDDVFPQKESHLLNSLFDKFENQKDLLGKVFTHAFIDLSITNSGAERYKILTGYFPTTLGDDNKDRIIIAALGHVKNNFNTNYQDMFANVKLALGEKQFQRILETDPSIEIKERSAKDTPNQDVSGASAKREMSSISVKTSTD